jgi:hypothetical protein
MAFPALYARMFPFEVVARLLVVEGPWIPLDERKVEAVVIGVALHAFLAGSWLDAIRKVQAFVGRETRCDFAMAVEAFENGLAAQLMAGGTASGAFQIFVCASKRAGRNLSVGVSEHKPQNAKCQPCGAYLQSRQCSHSNWQSRIGSGTPL